MSLKQLLYILTTIQNSPTFMHQDIMTFAGMCNLQEVSDHVWTSFERLTQGEKLIVLNIAKGV